MNTVSKIKNAKTGFIATSLSVLLLACSSGTDIESDLGIENAPDWVNEGSVAVSDDDGRYIQGVGMSQPLNDMALQKSTADNRARAELAQVVSSFIDVSLDDYAASNGDANSTNIERVISTFSKTSLNGSKIKARWKNPETNVIYSFAELDLEKVEEMIEQSTAMNKDMKKYLDTALDTKFDRFIKESETEK
ncbi:LPP20 family lipoprotein [Thalassotalea crassostreae]|uniref:LPP20 family lipoprotein n=1 Tax=Thalassotalea crassostreae TaxID=1763536 RepID=UPI000838ED58|nr:LPP20 family lipoprotein [Thalassotalea crassostreae]